MRNLLILGAGGHGKVIAEAAELEKKYDEIAFLDDNSDTDRIFNFSVIGKLDDYRKFKDKYRYAFVAIGNNTVRLKFINELIKEGFMIPNIVHPNASISKYSKIEIGTAILSGAIVNTNSIIGKGCILNINSIVDHDCNVEDGVHISSGAIVRSMVNIGELSIIGEGACITQGKNISKNTIINAGIVI